MKMYILGVSKCFILVSNNIVKYNLNRERIFFLYWKLHVNISANPTHRHTHTILSREFLHYL